MVQDAACQRGQEEACSGRLDCKEVGKIGSSREVAARRGATSWAAETQGEGLAECGRRRPWRKMPRPEENTGECGGNAAGS